ncbi:PTS sugar transporter subunit IIC [Mollicutes bacterium LVI A0039]|nr:PTS sugar transporter subunit IIC [Mollicutes bacterium LVI A0039]
MELSIIQILLLSLLGACAILDSLMFQVGFSRCVVIGLIAGLIVGDVTSGLYIGGTLGLLILGVGTYGGASMPDYQSGTIIAVALVATSGGSLDVQTAVALAVPVGLLLLNFDILARYCNSYIVILIEKAVALEKYDLAYKYNLLGFLTWGGSRFIPIFLALLLGNAFIEDALDFLTTNASWLLDGLAIAGGILPVVGICVLLKYLPVKQYYYFAILGFLLVAYLNVPIMGVALFGLVIAVITFNANTNQPASVIGVDVIEEGDYDEYDE